MKAVRIAVQALLILIVVGCAGMQVGVAKYTGFTELPFPSNVYASGQIIEVYSSPSKVEVTFAPEIPWDKATISDGWQISSTETDNIKSNFALEISKILKGTAGFSSDKKVKVEFTDTKTRLIPKNIIFASVSKSIKEDPSLSMMLKSYINKGTHFDVITQTLSATISFSIVDTSGIAIDVDSEVIEKLNSAFKLNFAKKSGEDRTVSGSNLVVGIHYDPKMIDIILN